MVELPTRKARNEDAPFAQGERRGPDLGDQVQRKAVVDTDGHEEDQQQAQLQQLRDELHVEEKGGSASPLLALVAAVHREDEVLHGHRGDHQQQQSPFEAEQQQDAGATHLKHLTAQLQREHGVQGNQDQDEGLEPERLAPTDVRQAGYLCVGVCV